MKKKRVEKRMDTIDASISVKWFKKGEMYEKEALDLLSKIKSFDLICIANEWLILETIRALVKANYSKEDIDDAYANLTELMKIDAIRKISVSEVLPLAKNLERDLELYSADAVHLATALATNSKILWSEDEHLQKKKVKDYVKKYGLMICSLEDISH